MSLSISSPRMITCFIFLSLSRHPNLSPSFFPHNLTDKSAQTNCPCGSKISLTLVFASSGLAWPVKTNVLGDFYLPSRVTGINPKIYVDNEWTGCLPFHNRERETCTFLFGSLLFSFQLSSSFFFSSLRRRRSSSTVAKGRPRAVPPAHSAQL